MKSARTAVALTRPALGALAVLLLALLLAPAANASSPIDTIGVYEGHNGRGDGTRTSVPECPTGPGGCAVDAFEANFLNGRQVSHVLDFVNELQRNPGAIRLGAWNDIVSSGRELVLSVGMFPPAGAPERTCANSVVDSPPVPNGGNNCLKAGANGAFDDYWQKLATNLVNNGLSHIIIRPGWEMNGQYFEWSGSCRPTDYINYWHRIVDDMNGENGGVTGAAPPDFEYAWSPHLGNQNLPDYLGTARANVYCQGDAQQGNFKSAKPADIYPGNQYVDYIGADTYDNFVDFWSCPPNANSCRDILNKNGFGLNQLEVLAANKGKPLALPEWGLVSSDPDNYMPRDEFMDHIYGWIRTRDVSFAIYFDRDQGGTDANPETKYALVNFPNGRAQYTADFGKLGSTAGGPLAPDTTVPWGTTTRITVTPTCNTQNVTGKVVSNPTFSSSTNGYVLWSLQRHFVSTHKWTDWNNDGIYLVDSVGQAGNFSTPLSGSPANENGLATGITDKPLGNGAYRVRASYSPNNNFTYDASDSAWTKFYLTGC